ncbi:RNA polymerase sigma factor (sigma-70 family) [Ereboglobus sp. PH5-5]|uniref:RNA polymerase sigma factor n=1 Tax=Ereboglobus sp. PH5-5 TaxID=2940529 RepID=UPI0024054891|nr:sigma-70 family RNA polymerase sigma factor [Ereboglobus sp. PH5-5]MDF9833484.1 RNA polymerase sigma factor (sigma-70 family) [Ereboglobus sp. PH5-5]
MPPDTSDPTRWFEENLLPHEPMLRAWLKSQFVYNHSEIDDVVQEAFARVLQAHANREVRSPKAFLFVTARNLALMRARHRAVAKEEPITEIDGSSIMDEAADVPHAVARNEELELLTKAIQSLPDRCRQVLTLRKIYGMSQKETAAELGIAEHTVEVQSVFALKKLNAFFREHLKRDSNTGIPHKLR